VATSEPDTHRALQALYAWAHRSAETNELKEVNSAKAFYTFFLKRVNGGLSPSSIRRCLKGEIPPRAERYIRAGIEAIRQEFGPVALPAENSTQTLSISRPTRDKESDLGEVHQGVWTLVHFRSVRENGKQNLPPKQLRTALIIYGDRIGRGHRREVEIYGGSTFWKGQAYCLNNKIYFTARERKFGNEDLHIICFPAHGADKTPQHEGIVIGIGLSTFDRDLIYSSRCLIKKDIELSLDVQETRQKLLNDDFRRSYCRYVSVSQLENPASINDLTALGSHPFTTASEFRTLVRPSKWTTGERIILQT
jgi:hypothetical protein